MGLDQHFVVADAEPLIALSRLGELELLQQLLGEWLHETSVEIMDWRAIHPGIDPGEANSICLAEQHPKSLLIIDDRAGRLEAKARGLRYIGLLGLIVQAKRKGKLNEARPFLCGLRKVGYFMSDVLIERVLREAGEQ